MAKLNELPSTEVISAMRGKVDFYYWMGIPVARTWPRWKPRAFTAEESANQLKFTAVAKETGMVDEQIREGWRALAAQGKGEAWNDAFRAAGMGKGWVSWDGS